MGMEKRPMRKPAEKYLYLYFEEKNEAWKEKRPMRTPAEKFLFVFWKK